MCNAGVPNSSWSESPINGSYTGWAGREGLGRGEETGLIHPAQAPGSPHRHSPTLPAPAQAKATLTTRDRHILLPTWSQRTRPRNSSAGWHSAEVTGVALGEVILCPGTFASFSMEVADGNNSKLCLGERLCRGSNGRTWESAEPGRRRGAG